MSPLAVWYICHRVDTDANQGPLISEIDDSSFRLSKNPRTAKKKYGSIAWRLRGSSKGMVTVGISRDLYMIPSKRGWSMNIRMRKRYLDKIYSLTERDLFCMNRNGALHVGCVVSI